MIFPSCLKWVVLWPLTVAALLENLAALLENPAALLENPVALLEKPTPPLRVSGGLLRGLYSLDGTHARYTGIPYATVTKRFQAAQPNPQWSGEFHAYNEQTHCTQKFGELVVGQEDCLVLNVYTPVGNEHDSLLPVMVYIPGGALRTGSGSPFLYGPKYLIKKNVILITINYRLGVLGFLCLGIEEAPGNIGLKDQVEALKWIKENIRVFGGDPDNITIFGVSAGSASAMYHLLSPLSRGLFNRAIMESGVALGPASFQFEPLKIASLLAKQFGYETENPNEIYDLFMNTSANDLVRKEVPRKKGDIVLSEYIFVPCLEKELPGINRFINDTPYNLLSRGEYTKVPVIIGHNNKEGLAFISQENVTTFSEIDFYEALPRDLLFPTESEARETAAMLNETYIGNNENNLVFKLARFEGDSAIVYPVVSAIDLMLHTNDKPTYAYKFSYGGFLNILKFYSGFPLVSGATHGDQEFYLFSTPITTAIAWLESKMINTMTSLWTNFAKTGNPTPEQTVDLPLIWQPANKTDPQVFVIDEQPTTAPLWEDDAILYWNATYAKYRRL